MSLTVRPPAVRRLVSRWNVFIEPSAAPVAGRPAVVVSGALAMPRHCGSDLSPDAGEATRCATSDARRPGPLGMGLRRLDLPEAPSVAHDCRGGPVAQLVRAADDTARSP